MYTDFTITLFKDDGKTVKLGADTLEEAEAIARKEIEKDPRVAVNITTTELIQGQPGQTKVNINRYEKKNGKIVKSPY